MELYEELGLITQQVLGTHSVIMKNFSREHKLFRGPATHPAGNFIKGARQAQPPHYEGGKELTVLPPVQVSPAHRAGPTQPARRSLTRRRPEAN